MNTVSNDSVRATLALNNLHQVIDPEIGVNIVDLGLVYRLFFDAQAQKVTCTMTLTTPYCPMGEAITNNVREVLSQTFPEEEIEIVLTFEPAWNYEMISNEGRAFLNI